MFRWTSLDDVPADLGKTVVTLGIFDGVHRGHRALLNTVTRTARERGLAAIAVTFHPHPVAVLQPERAPKEICGLDHRLDLLEGAGLDGVVVVEFTREYAVLAPEDFVVQTFVMGLRADVVVIGEDSRFGRQNAGDANMMCGLGRKHGFDVIVQRNVGKVEENVRVWSSTNLRAAIAAGNVRLAAQILDRPHRIVGEAVVTGQKACPPIANLVGDNNVVAPAEGVYAGWLERLSLPAHHPCRRVRAAIVVTSIYAFDQGELSADSHVDGGAQFDIDVETAWVDFGERLCDNVQVGSIQVLMEQVRGQGDGRGATWLVIVRTLAASTS